MENETPTEPTTRDKILIAAATMLGEDPTARLSVRAVAARAGVSTGSLRHFFPTQQELLDTVIAGVFGWVFPGDPIRDTSLSPSDRLVACLQQLLATSGTGDQAREMWRVTLEAYVAVRPSAGSTSTFLALEREGRRRIEEWLTVLTEEGAIPPGDTVQRARFLSTVVDGLSVERALPTDGWRMAAEADTLRLAVLGVVHDAPAVSVDPRSGDLPPS